MNTSIIPFMTHSKPPVIASYSTFSRNSTATSDSVPKPSGTQAGDLLIAFVSRVLLGNNYTSSGWQELPRSADSSRISVFWKIATGSEGANISFSGGNNQRVPAITMLRITGADTVMPIESFAWSSLTVGASTTADISTPGILNVTVVSAGTIHAGDLVAGSAVPAGVTILPFGTGGTTGTGGTGTYALSDSSFTEASGNTYTITSPTTAPSVSTTKANDLLVIGSFLGPAANTSLNSTSTFDAAITKQFDVTSYSGGNAIVSIGTKNLLEVGASGTYSITPNTGLLNQSAISIAIRPAIPQKTYATWSASDIYSASVSDNKLNISSSTGIQGGGRATIGKSSGKWYWEVQAYATNGCNIGIADAGLSLSAWSSGFDFIYYFAYSGIKQYNIGGGYNNVAYGASWAAKDVISVLMDLDNHQISFWKNGVDQGVALTGLPSVTWYPAALFPGSAGSRGQETNFGQSPFVYTPPAGYNYGIYL